MIAETEPSWTRSPAAWTACVLLTLAAATLAATTLTRSLTDATLTPRDELVQRIDINAASVHELDLLPEIGPALAQRIVDHRAEHGPFPTLDDLDDVRGIGPKTVAALADHAVAASD